jgi:hypothetical protein
MVYNTQNQWALDFVQKQYVYFSGFLLLCSLNTVVPYVNKTFQEVRFCTLKIIVVREWLKLIV